MTAQRALEIAQKIQDDTQVALALENLAGQSSTLGFLPDALRYRERAEEIHRRQGNAYVLAFDLTNRAELLIRLGHGEKAETLLREVDAGIAKGIDAYVGRARRQKVLRTLRATIDGRYMEAVTLGVDVGPGTGKDSRWDRTSRVGPRRSCPRTFAPGRNLRRATPATVAGAVDGPRDPLLEDCDATGIRPGRKGLGRRVGIARGHVPRPLERTGVARERDGRGSGTPSRSPRRRACPRGACAAGLAAPRDQLVQ